MWNALPLWLLLLFFRFQISYTKRPAANAISTLQLLPPLDSTYLQSLHSC
jgi:hypothetical protein